MKSDFAEILSHLRRERGLSQRLAAADLDVSQALLSHYENGARAPKLEFVVRACDYYNVTSDYILGRIDEKTQNSIRTPGGCESGPRLISAVNTVLNTLDELSDKVLCEAAIEFLLIPIENVTHMLRNPDTPYNPMRDAEYKMAEAALVKNLHNT